MASPGSSTGVDEAEPEHESDHRLEPIIDEEEEFEYSERQGAIYSGQASVTSATSPNFAKSSTRHSSETPSAEGSKDSPSGSTASGGLALNLFHTHDPAFQSDSERADWSHLPADIQYYLNSFCENISHYHYCFPSDADRFFSIILPNVAVRYEPLLNAVVGFAAYHETLQNPDGKMEDFLKYYNKSVVLLLNSIKTREPQTIAMLLTVLQLASIEEYLGDWINIMGHQKAAMQIFTNLFTPEAAMQSPITRMAFTWYSRFDAFVAVLGGFPVAAPREWFEAAVDACREQIANNPDNVEWKLEEAAASMRLISVDMSVLYPQGHRGEISPEAFTAGHDLITANLLEWRRNLESFTDKSYLVTEFPGQKALDESDIVDPYAPGVLCTGPMFPTTLLMSELNSVMIMHKSQSSTMRKDILYREIGEHAYNLCQIFEAIERWRGTPSGVLMMVQAGIAISALFLPQDARHHNWIRRKFALMETLGYIHPITIRSKMADLFGDPSCVRWWLPNDEGFTPILRSIREFADERNAVAVSAQMENIREVNHVFAKLQLGE
ncbi:uncharacterized protein DNG_02508 [Cephalotrichum gorgonifer]|uniref:C6 finger domain protein n=1 Tax=Cephalotrichum gorgonifer TaxID=2041049 RepID=A0AAE8MTP4_9PEZI|nr:uncharacterized protein DNG_02508 [Cephalotrichum gorgonifer]